jgi:pimeloyl-ACP methyl ester carboxylesterase
VKAVAPARIAVGDAELPVYVSQDWTKPQPGVTRAVLVLHGLLRNANVYYRSAITAMHAAGPAGRGSLMIVPQFLATVDMAAHDLPPTVLHWSATGWEGGDPAEGPSTASSFDALDAILTHLADRHLFPSLRTVVVAGHSGGAQVVQRYAIAGKAEAALTAAGIAVRYVVANPSSYAYFDASRPFPPVSTSCPRFNDWKYGMDHRPPYLAAPTPAALEAAYIARDVTYLIGALDRNPEQPALDRSCMGEAQGATRYDRAYSYFGVMRIRDGAAFKHHIIEVPGVGHDGDGMFTSPQGVTALFGGDAQAKK